MKFLFLDDDAFHPAGIRSPEIYYPLIGAHNILSIYNWSKEKTKVVDYDQAVAWMEKNGCPDFMSFDNDLGTELEGIDLARWMVNKDLMEPGFFPKNFQFFVHSQNVIAKERIYSLLNSYFNNKGFIE